MSLTLSLNGRGAAITFDYDPARVVQLKRAVPGVTWEPAAKAWQVPRDRINDAIEFCEAYGGYVAEEVLEASSCSEDDVRIGLERATARMAAAGLTLRPYQPRGVEALLRHRNFILGWDMRTGKTLVALAAVPEGAPLIVVTTASAKYQWEEWVRRVLPHYTVTVQAGRSGFMAPRIDEARIVSWASLPDGLVPHEGTVLIGDEAHKAKNPRAERTHRFRKMHKAVMAQRGRSWGLTGTPIQNSPLELWNLLATYNLNITVFGSWEGFMRRFNGRKEFGILTFGLPTPEVPGLLRRAMDRLSFAEAAPHLPANPEPQFIPVDVSISAGTARAWEERFPTWEAALRAGREPQDGWAESRAELARVKAVAAPGVIEDLIEGGGGPVIVFSAHRDPVIALGSRDGWGMILGGMSSAERDDVRRRFQAGLLDGIACTIGAGGEALTLSRARSILCIDLSYNPGDNAQAMARGNDAEKATLPGLYVMTARGTIDERVMALLAYKTRMVRATLEDRPAPPRLGAETAGRWQKVS